MQTLANALPGIGCPELQAEINQEGLAVLEDYRRTFDTANAHIESPDWLDLTEPYVISHERDRSGSSGSSMMGSMRDRNFSMHTDNRENSIESEERVPDMWEDLKAIVVQQLESEAGVKDVQLLVDSFMLCRAMYGGRATCCKSAKDRTSMASTLEMAVLAAAKGLFGREPYTRDQLMRQLMSMLRGEDGVRLRICELNTGKKMYAFNVLQQSTLPEMLKPPPEFAGSCAS